jgi:hypothetical protein
LALRTQFLHQIFTTLWYNSLENALEGGTSMKFWKVVAVVAAVVVLGTAAMAAVAVAQEGTDGVKDRLADLGQEFREAVAGILGISVDEYDAAVDQAREQVLDKAVEEGDLTQEQADRVRERADGRLGRLTDRRGC